MCLRLCQQSLQSLLKLVYIATALGLILIFPRRTLASAGATLHQHYEVHNETFSHNAGLLRVLSLNTWGLGWPWSMDRGVRFRALREAIVNSNYDVILLQEVWFRHDYELLRSALPYVTYFEVLNSGCSGQLLPLGCSGLLILSRHPLEDVQFQPFSVRGSFWNFDGEIFVGKGVGRARIRWKGLAVDVYTTHLVSYTNNPNRDNNFYRYLQAHETVSFIQKSDADVKIFGGDINALPIQGKRQPYAQLSSILTDALLDKYPDASWHPWFATFGNHDNTYTRHDAPERIDFLMYTAAPHMKMKTVEFSMPMYRTKNKQGRVVSLSDHEALQADFLIEPREQQQQQHYYYLTQEQETTDTSDELIEVTYYEDLDSSVAKSKKGIDSDFLDNDVNELMEVTSV